jgi:nicotinamide-nucleotide adenylyltransferase
MSIGLFIGRFQPFHKGHLHAIQELLKECDQVIIGIGSSQYSKTATNPFSAQERKEMIISTLKNNKIDNFSIFLIPDIENDNEWINHVKKIIPTFDIIFTGSPLSKKLFTEKGYFVKPVFRFKNISASEIRLRILKDLEWNTMVSTQVLEIFKQIGAKERIKNCSC